MEYTKEELVYVWLDSFLGLEYKHKVKLYECFLRSSSMDVAIDNAKEYVLSEIGENVYATIKGSLNKKYLDFIVDTLNRKGIRAVTYISKDYPETLKNIPHPPFVLYVKGDAKLLSANIFAIVGSRKSLPISLAIAENYSKTLVKAGFVLATGIAEGVDSTVLKAAISSGGKAISVIAGGFDNVYPTSNYELLEKVIEKGVAISEYPPEVRPKPYHFPIRNRIISALSKGALIVSGAKKSGTLYTAEYAEEYGKDLFVIPYSVGIASGAGCNDLIKRGAMLTDTPQDILDFYGITVKEEEKRILSPLEKSILNTLKNGQKHVEKICAELSMRTFDRTPALSMLELGGFVVKNGNTYASTGNYSEE